MELKLSIDSIVDGIAPSFHEQGQNQYLGGVGIDPEGIINAGVVPGMALVPTQVTKFSGGKISGAPMWIMGNGKDNLLYTYCSDGTVLSYTSAFGSETVVSSTIPGGKGNGAAYYNNYLYFTTSADVSRYGPLDGVPSFTNSVWTGSTLSSQIALSSGKQATYPGPGGNGIPTYPNHVMHSHVDGSLYFCDISANGQGLIHKIKTKKGTVAQGDSEGGSKYGALSLPQGYYPTAIASYGNDLAILCLPEGNYTNTQSYKTGGSALFIWDTFSPTFYRQIDIPDPVATAVINQNGVLKIFSGLTGSYVRLSEYVGSYSLNPIDFINEGSPPFAGAVDSFANMTAWGANGSNPATYSGVMTRGYRNPNISPTARNVITRVTDSNNGGGVVTALLFADNSNAINAKYPITGWATNTPSYGIDSYGGTPTLNSSIKTKVFNVGQEFEILHIRIPLATPLVAGSAITMTIVTDDGQTTNSINQINLTNYPANPANPQLIDIKQVVKGYHNFYFQFTWGSTSPTPIVLPITIKMRTLRDVKLDEE